MESSESTKGSKVSAKKLASKSVKAAAKSCRHQRKENCKCSYKRYSYGWFCKLYSRAGCCWFGCRFGNLVLQLAIRLKS